MLNQIATSPTVETMSSLEIAKLTGKNHANVMRDIREMLENLENSELNSQNYPQNQVAGGAFRFDGTYLDASNRQSKCYNLPRRETEILITGYDVVRRAAVIDRWMELEAKNRKPVQPQLPPSELQLTKEILDSAITLGMSPEQVLVLLGKQLPKLAKLPKPKKVKIEYNYINIRNLVPADKLPKVQKAMQQMTLVRMLRSGPNYGQFVLDKGRADLLNARMPNGWGSLEVREGFTDTFLKLLEI